ncbi:uncharacterized protein LOC108673431 [Hyalella azteca]|uniref:Uncharacterized protein LOC108673431 n=1 Tax=Hyalella azteca TaxID=294128 RepID=A0A8B7NSR1_HYAAZ|nr:uncharacterized protein LOC108673431 [Hyalella azteca]
MKLLRIVLAVSVISAVRAGPVPSADANIVATISDSAAHKSEAFLVRPRRWILSWLLSHSAAMDHAQKRANESAFASDAQISNDISVTDDSEDSVEAHKLPGTVAVDLSGDTRVNYQEGRGRMGALASESDAEIFDWNLLQEDRNRNAGEENPHYYQSNAGRDRSPSALSRPTAYGQPSSLYGQRPARPASGILESSQASGLNRFNRFPITFEQSQAYANSDRRSSSIIRPIRA